VTPAAPAFDAGEVVGGVVGGVSVHLEALRAPCEGRPLLSLHLYFGRTGWFF
jgi:hypothetical protein